jgi:uridine kinase
VRQGIFAPEIWVAVEDHLRLQPRCVLAIDGPDCAGKTTLAGDVAALAEKHGITTRIAHLDDTFRGVASLPRTNPDAVCEFLLDFFDHDATHSFLTGDEQLLIIEGMFLLRVGLCQLYDISVRLEIDERVSFERAYARDGAKFASWGDFAVHHVTQCLPAQRVYRELCAPHISASLTFDGNC